MVMLFATSSSHLGTTPLSCRLLLPTLEDTVHVDDLLLPVLPEQCEGIHERLGDEDLDEDVPDDSGGSNNDAVDVSAEGEGDQFEGLSAIGDNKELTDEDACDNDDEEIVVEEVSEDVELIFLEFPCVEEVEDLEEHEDVEEN